MVMSEVSAAVMMATDQACLDSQNDHSIPSLPGCDAGADCDLPCAYAGTLSSSDTADHNLFYWMYKSSDYDNAPVAIWLNGGPGASSAFGNFLLNGPLKITETINSSTGSDVYTFTVKNA